LVKRYGNVLDTSKQRLVFYDRNATLLAGYPLSKSILGHSMFSPENQMIISDEGRPLVNELFKKALSGQADTEQFDLGDGPTLVTARPIYVEGNATYFLNIPTPFSQILTPIQNLLQNEFLLNIVLLVPFTGAISYVVFMLSQWGGRLNNEVKKRTQELELANKSFISEALELEKSNKRLDNANKELEMAYENLKLNEKLQKEFVNVAAHELRTPTQSIMGFLELMEKIPENSTYYFERV
jgi:signal transduction histidine kinase